MARNIESLEKLLSRARNWDWLLGILKGLLLSGLSVGVVSAWVAAHTAWLDAYGAIGWWCAALVGSLIGLLMILVASLIRYQIIRADAVRRWSREVDAINPLDREFNRKRIKVAQLEDPVRHIIENKRFIDCEFDGPANISFLGVNANGTRFSSCDIIMIKPAETIINNVIMCKNIQFVGGSITRCTIYIQQKDIEPFKRMGALFVSLTGDPDLDGMTSPSQTKHYQ